MTVCISIGSGLFYNQAGVSVEPFTKIVINLDGLSILLFYYQLARLSEEEE